MEAHARRGAIGATRVGEEVFDRLAMTQAVIATPFDVDIDDLAWLAVRSYDIVAGTRQQQHELNLVRRGVAEQQGLVNAAAGGRNQNFEGTFGKVHFAGERDFLALGIVKAFAELDPSVVETDRLSFGRA
jgi:hypothetical protein